MTRGGGTGVEDPDGADAGSSRLVLHRAGSWAGKLRTFRVLLDGHEIGQIADEQTSLFRIPHGRHEPRLKMDWCRSAPVVVDLAPHEQADFVCRAVFRSALDPIIRPSRYIDLLASAQPLLRQRTFGEDLLLRLLLSLIGVFTIVVMAIAHVGVVVSVAVGTVVIMIAYCVPIPTHWPYRR
jgi:hypothetical protein